MSKIIADVTGLVADATAIKTDCLSKINWREVKVVNRVADSTTCWNDVMTVVSDAGAVYADIEAKNVTKAMADGETLVTDVK